jgi:hypothetical protein
VTRAGSVREPCSSRSPGRASKNGAFVVRWFSPALPASDAAGDAAAGAVAFGFTAAAGFFLRRFRFFPAGCDAAGDAVLPAASARGEAFDAVAAVPQTGQKRAASGSAEPQFVQ